MLEQGLTDYIMSDVVWTGGISELLRIARPADGRHIPMSPHNAMGPLQDLGVDFDIEKLEACLVYRRPGT